MTADHTDEVVAHVERTNPGRGTARDAFVGSNFYDWAWPSGPVMVATNDPRLVRVAPASPRDVKRYAAHIRKGSPVPAVVLGDRGSEFRILDGAHRIAAARAAGVTHVPAYIGMPLRRTNPGRQRNPEAKPVRALVLMHVSSLDSYAALVSADEAMALGQRMARAVNAHDGPVYVIDQGWEITPDSRSRTTFLNGLKRGVVSIRFDEDREEWGPFLRKLKARLKRDRVTSVIVGGLWYDPDEKSGCASRVLSDIRRYMPATAEPALVGCEAELRPRQQNPEAKPTLVERARMARQALYAPSRASPRGEWTEPVLVPVEELHAFRSHAPVAHISRGLTGKARLAIVRSVPSSEVEPIEISIGPTKMVLEDGHHRLLVARERGDATIPVQFVFVKQEQLRRPEDTVRKPTDWLAEARRLRDEQGIKSLEMAWDWFTDDRGWGNEYEAEAAKVVWAEMFPSMRIPEAQARYGRRKLDEYIARTLDLAARYEDEEASGEKEPVP